MSRPSIILCSSRLKLIWYKLWKNLSEFTNRFVTSKKLIYFMLNTDNSILNFILNLSNHDQYFKLITEEIHTNCCIQK